MENGSFIAGKLTIDMENDPIYSWFTYILKMKMVIFQFANC